MSTTRPGPDPAKPTRFRAPRRVLGGALLWIVGSVQFLLAMVVVQLAWTTPYDIWTNAVSDLGAVTCAENAMGTSYVCSPWHVLFNASIVVLGLLLAVGTLEARARLPKGRAGMAGSVLLIVSGIGAATVGIFPEDVQGVPHSIGALLAFVGAGAAMVVYAPRCGRSRSGGPTGPFLSDAGSSRAGRSSRARSGWSTARSDSADWND